MRIWSSALHASQRIVPTWGEHQAAPLANKLPSGPRFGHLGGASRPATARARARIQTDGFKRTAWSKSMRTPRASFAPQNGQSNTVATLGLAFLGGGLARLRLPLCAHMHEIPRGHGPHAPAHPRRGVGPRRRTLVL